MESSFEYVFLHGFRTDVPDARGAAFAKLFREKGIELHQLDTKGGKGHGDATVTIGLEALDAYYKSKNKPLRLIGMSMGGLISSLYASRNPTHVEKLILLNPAVNLKETWRTIADPNDPTAFDEWKEKGVRTFMVFPEGSAAQIPFSYVEDSLQYPSYPNIQCPSIVFIGGKDDEVPPKNGYVLQLEQDNPELMQLIELDDDHLLIAPETISKMWEYIVEFFELAE